MPTSALTDSLEAQLLMLCARSDQSAAQVAIRDLIAKPLDWDKFLSLGAEHRVRSLIHSASRGRDTYFPSEVRETLKINYHDNVRNIMALTVQTRRLLALFKSNSVDAIPYKGLALAAKAYADEASREIMDIDLVVHRHDLARVHKLLITDGYEPTDQFNGWVSIYRTQHRAYIKSGRLIEIHWRFLPDLFMLPPEPIWKTARQELVCDEFAFQVSTEDMVILLCTHGTSHWWSRLSHVCDLTAFIRRNPQIDWHKVMEQAQQANVIRMLNIGLLIARQLLQAAIPADVVKHLNTDQIAVSIAHEICDTFFDHPTEGRYREQVEIKRNLQVRERLIDKIGYLLQNLFLGDLTEQDLNWIRLPHQLLFLYRVIRPIRLVVQYGFRVTTRR